MNIQKRVSLDFHRQCCSQSELDKNKNSCGRYGCEVFKVLKSHNHDLFSPFQISLIATGCQKPLAGHLCFIVPSIYYDCSF